jgi:two-component system, sensor histidine kinase and response regulator
MPKPKILVVDDQLLNIRLLERKLEQSEMEVRSCTNGPKALELAREIQPDVILLDIMMAGMNGIEVCRLLKQDPRTREIPVIFLTALTSKEEKIKGLESGGADYVTKPLELDEILARVRTQIRIVEEHRRNIQLTRQLEQSRRQAAIMHLTDGMAHNMNNLLGVMVGYVSLLQRNAANPEKILSSCERLEAAVNRMTGIVHQLTVIGHFKSLQKEPASLARILKSAISRFRRVTNTKAEVRTEIRVPADFQFLTNRELLEACLERLLQNACESYFTGDTDSDPRIGEIVLEATEVELEAQPHLRLRVLDRGKGLDAEIRDSVFEPFVSSSSVVGRGMGLTIARHSVTCLGGSIELSDREGGGTEAVVTLPLQAEEAAADGE